MSGSLTSSFSPLTLAMMGLPTGGGGGGTYTNSTSPSFPSLQAQYPLASNAAKLQAANPQLPWYAVPGMFQAPPPSTAVAAVPQGSGGLTGGFTVDPAAFGGKFDPVSGHLVSDYGGGYDAITGMPLLPASNPLAAYLNMFNAGNWGPGVIGSNPEGGGAGGVGGPGPAGGAGPSAGEA